MIRTCIFLFTIFSALPLVAEDVVTQSGGGGVNWTQGYVWADGYGTVRDGVAERKKRLLARRAAQVDAYRNLAEFVKGVRVSSETVVLDMTLESDVVRTKIDALVKGAVMVKDHYQNEVAQVTMRIYFDGDFSGTINSTIAQQDPTSFSFFPAGFEQYRHIADAFLSLGFSRAHAASNAPDLIRSSSELELANRLLQRSSEQTPEVLLRALEQDVEKWRNSKQYTGLLVDASHIGQFELATIPRLRNSEGEVIYPKKELLMNELSARRPVSYDFDVEDAIRNARVAVTPYVIRAQSTFKSRHSDLVLSEADSQFITAHSQMMDIINQAGVMIVVAE